MENFRKPEAYKSLNASSLEIDIKEQDIEVEDYFSGEDSLLYNLIQAVRNIFI